LTDDVGYGTFYNNATAYQEALNGADASWAKIPAMRQAMKLHKNVPYFFYLSPHALITNLDYSLHTQLLKPKILERTMLRDRPIVPPDSVIKTLNHVRGDHVDLVITQDNFGISSDSFVIRSGEWAKFFLDTWFDPLYRSFNFQKEETHALEHIVQWHPSILTHLAVVPQNLLNAYSRGSKETLWKQGDFLIRFPECEKGEEGRSCEKEMTPYWQSLYNQQH
jgi:mannan polymerase II complex MNN11 subunit